MRSPPDKIVLNARRPHPAVALTASLVSSVRSGQGCVHYTAAMASSPAVLFTAFEPSTNAG